MEPGNKHVSFGNSTVTEVPRWITRDDVHQNRPRGFIRGQPRGSRRRIHGWLEIPLADGPMCILNESFSSTSKLDVHMELPCKGFCVWHSLAQISNRFPECTNQEVLQKWNALRGVK